MNVTVALFPATSQVALEILQALRPQKGVTIIGVNSFHDPRLFEYDDYTTEAPQCGNDALPAWADNFIKTNQVAHWYNCNEAALEALTHLSPHPADTVRTFGDKWLTYQLTGVAKWPEVYGRDIFPVPAFQKPKKGHSSIGCKVVTNMEEVIPDHCIVCEYVQGREFTVDAFSVNGQLMYFGVRERNKTLGGVSIISEMVENVGAGFWLTMRNISSKMKMNGAWFAQMIGDPESMEEAPTVLEVGCRIAGSSAASRSLGVNLPLMELYHLQGHKVQPLISGGLGVSWKILQHRTTLPAPPPIVNLYLDWDDTIEINGKVNPDAIALCYAYPWKSITIITRSSIDKVRKAMHRMKISRSLFPEILSLDGSDTKVSYMKPNAILIDDSFRERMELVQRQLPGLYAYEPSVIKMLLP